MHLALRRVRVVALGINVDLDRVVSRAQRIDPRGYPFDGAARVRLTGDDEDRGANGVDVRHRVAPRIALGHLLRRAAVGGLVPGLELRRGEVVRRDELPRRDAREDRAPPVGLRARVETGEASTPRPAVPEHTLGSGDA